MPVLFQSPTYHHVSSLTRYTSANTSELKSAPRLKRSFSVENFKSSNKFMLPSYGYGGGYMARSLSRSGSSLFGRSLSSTALNKIPPMHNVSVQRNTPHFCDKYPYIRYSYSNINTGLAVSTQTDLKSFHFYGIKDIGTKRWLEGKLNTYNTGLFIKPFYNERIERPITPARNYVRFMPIDDAVNMYKNKYMTFGTLSKYWLNFFSYSQQRNRELNFKTLNLKKQINYPYYSKIAYQL